MAQIKKKFKETFRKVRLAGGKMPVARDGEIIGQWFIKNIRYLKCRERLRPSDHIFKDGKWQLLYKATNGYFWRWVQRDAYLKMHHEETEKVKKYLKTYKMLAEKDDEKQKHLLAIAEYEELLRYLQGMLKIQKTRWVVKDNLKRRLRTPILKEERSPQ